MAITPLIVVDYDTPDTDFDKIYLLNVGECFKFTKNIETLYIKIGDRIPQTLSKFTVKVATPGSAYFTMFGVNTFVVAEKY